MEFISVNLPLIEEIKIQPNPKLSNISGLLQLIKSTEKTWKPFI